MFSTGHGERRCGDSFVTKKSTTWTGKLLNISLDPSKWESFNDVKSCTVDIGLSDFFIVRYLEVNMTYNESTTTQPTPACFFISKFEFLIHLNLKPVQVFKNK